MTVQIAQHDQRDKLAGILAGQGQLAEMASKIPALHAIAVELFPGEIGIEIESDPEISACSYLVFNVLAYGEIKEISARRREWHHRTNDLLRDDCHKVRLSITVEP